MGRPDRQWQMYLVRMPNLSVLVYLLLISTVSAKMCSGRARTGLSSNSVCNYATGEWESAYTYTAYRGGGAYEEPCVLPGVYLTWYNGDPIKEVTGVSQAECEELCRETEECDAWTLNTRNSWCALKREDQVKTKEQEGFVSG